MMKTLAVILLAVAGMTACDESPTSPSDPVGEVWRLASIGTGGTGPIVVPESERYTIQFLESGRVAVRADCNTCAGSYVLTGTALSLGALACTRAFCGTTSLDGMFMQALGQTRSLEQSGDRAPPAGRWPGLTVPQAAGCQAVPGIVRGSHGDDPHENRDRHESIFFLFFVSLVCSRPEHGSFHSVCARTVARYFPIEPTGALG